MGSEAARQEAERRYPYKAPTYGGRVLDDARIPAFVAGAEWQAAQPVTVTAEQVEEATAALSRWMTENGQDILLAEGLTIALAALGIEVTP